MARGRGSPARSTSVRKRRSSSLLVCAGRIDSLIAAFRFAAPRRRGWRSIRATKGVWSDSRSASARSRTRLSSCSWRSAARSSRVRATVVTGMPAWTVRSSGAIAATRTRIPSRVLSRLGTVRSTRVGQPSRIPQSAAAQRWLRTASGPHASTAAIHQPTRETRRYPTAYTPRWIRCRRFCLSRAAIAPRPSPSATNCPRATTPCCRSASSAIAASSPSLPRRTERFASMSCITLRSSAMAASSRGPCDAWAPGRNVCPT